METTGSKTDDDDTPHGIGRLPLAFRPSLHSLDEILAALTPFYGPNCPIAAVFHTEGSGVARYEATLGTLRGAIGSGELKRTPLLFIG